MLTETNVHVSHAKEHQNLVTLPPMQRAVSAQVCIQHMPARRHTFSCAVSLDFLLSNKTVPPIVCLPLVAHASRRSPSLPFSPVSIFLSLSGNPHVHLSHNTHPPHPTPHTPHPPLWFTVCCLESPPATTHSIYERIKMDLNRSGRRVWVQRGWIEEPPCLH